MRTPRHREPFTGGRSSNGFAALERCAARQQGSLYPRFNGWSVKGGSRPVGCLRDESAPRFYRLTAAGNRRLDRAGGLGATLRRDLARHENRVTLEMPMRLFHRITLVAFAVPQCTPMRSSLTRFAPHNRVRDRGEHRARHVSRGIAPRRAADVRKHRSAAHGTSHDERPGTGVRRT